MAVHWRKAQGIKILNQEGYMDVLNLPVADSTSSGVYPYIAVGDPVIWAAGTLSDGVTPLTAASDYNKFMGLAVQFSEDIDKQNFINVAVLCRAQVKLTTAAECIPGQGLTWDVGTNTAEWTWAKCSTDTSAMCWAIEYNPATSQTLKVRFDVYKSGDTTGERMFAAPQAP